MAEKLDQGIISIEADVKEAIALLQDLDLKKQTISKAVLRTIGTGGKQAIRKNYNSILHKRTGKLYKGIKSAVYKNGTKVVFSDDADSGKKTSKNGRLARYGFMLASGYTIFPKKEKVLRFQVDGKWVSAHSVTVKARDWMEPPLMRFVNSYEAEQRIDTALQKEVDKWVKRHGGTA